MRGNGAGYARAIGWGLAGCAIAYIAMVTLYWLSEAERPTNDPHEERVHFLRHVLADIEDAWDDIFSKAGRRYERPTLVLFTRLKRSACGRADAVTGPFYCPLDRKIYLDLSFFDALEHEYHTPGNFAQAYVIAHEVGHHLQLLLGVEYRVQALQAKSDTREVNQLSVRVELQADCLAGVWASWEQRRKTRLTPEDIEEALRATRALGDDTIQGLQPGAIMLDSFTHGSGEQRSYWFKRGLDAGKIAACDTFSEAWPMKPQ